MMNYCSLERSRQKINVAWFKLSEVIMRGEKERVLNMYRLLTHSLSNEILKIQLEADILRIFGDRNALFCYIKAAKMYKDCNELAQAIALYKIIISLAPETSEYQIALAALQEDLRNCFPPFIHQTRSLQALL